MNKETIILITYTILKKVTHTVVQKFRRNYLTNLKTTEVKVMKRLMLSLNIQVKTILQTEEQKKFKKRNHNKLTLIQYVQVFFFIG